MVLLPALLQVEEVLGGAHSQSSDHLAGVLADQRVRGRQTQQQQQQQQQQQH
jgi:hypothetical protein